jgi:hypothetical protein
MADNASDFRAQAFEDAAIDLDVPHSSSTPIARKRTPSRESSSPLSSSARNRPSPTTDREADRVQSELVTCSATTTKIASTAAATPPDERPLQRPLLSDVDTSQDPGDWIA